GPPELGAQLHQRAARTARPRECGSPARPDAALQQELAGPDREGADHEAPDREGTGDNEGHKGPPHGAVTLHHPHAAHTTPTPAHITRLCPDAEITGLGTAQGLEADLVPAAGLELATIDKVPFPRRPDGAALRFPGRFLGTLREVRGLMREREIDVVAG